MSHPRRQVPSGTAAVEFHHPKSPQHITSITKARTLEISSSDSKLIDEQITHWHNLGRGRLGMAVNINALIKHLPDMRLGKGVLLDMMRRRHITEVYLTEAHMDHMGYTQEINMLLDIHLGAQWITFISPCTSQGGRRYASCAAFIQLAADESTATYKAFRGVSLTGFPTAKIEPLRPGDTSNANPEGRYIIIQSTSQQNLHDTVVIYAPNTQANQMRLRHAKQIAGDISRYISWYKRNHPRRILSIVGDLNALLEPTHCYKERTYYDRPHGTLHHR